MFSSKTSKDLRAKCLLEKPFQRKKITAFLIYVSFICVNTMNYINII